jgi:aminobenzoyl-glutamate utilization protein B
MYIKNNLFIFVLSSIFSINIYSSSIEQIVLEHKDRFSDIALEIWDHAEMGYQEIKSSNLLATELENEGFKITKKCCRYTYRFYCRIWFKWPSYWNIR